ncbi:MAG: MgtC/SapB family protein, partial [Desulfomonilaceae bacterium]
TMPETELLALITGQGFSVANMSYSADREDNFFEYSMTIRTPSKDSMRSLPTILSATESITEFHIHQTGD